MRRFCVLAVLVSAALVLACSASLAVGYLKIHPSNPHYFQENGTGKPILVATYTAIVPTSTDYDYVAGIAEMGQRRISYARVWHFLPWAHEYAVWPWARSGTPNAPMGGNKLDMNSWNATYWSRMTDGLSRANTVGTYAEIHLFDRCGLSPSGYDRYQGNPWASDNNINNLEMPTASGNDGTPEFYQWSSRGNLRNQQERYIRKMIDETIAYPNAFYEIENEHWQSDSSGWADHYGQFVKDYISANYPTSPRLVSYSSIEDDDDLDQCYEMSAIDIVNKHYGNECENDPSILNDYIEDRWGYNKPINIDEFANGVTDPDLLREMCWTIVTSGGHYHLEDAQLSARGFETCENIRSFIALSGWNFINAAPDSGLVASGAGYCMADPGAEYVCYFPSGGNKTVNIASGNYRQEWWDPATGGFYNVSTFSHGGGNKSFSCPDGNDWVLHVTTAAAPVAVLNSKIASSITIDGATNDWNLGEFTTKIAGGNVGTGDLGIVEFDTDGVCYVGGHYDGMALFPTSAADHSVKIYSRNNASYLYLLMRIDDNDIRYPNGVDTNWGNDCVEIYLDPGNDGGTTGISNSTSDIQLVLDANNQKNVYMCTAGYAAQVLAGVTSAVVRDGTGWWLEARISKSALDPDIPATGTIGIDFVFRDNDNNNDNALSSITSWREPEVSGGFPTKIPNRWGDLVLQSAPDVTPPGPISSFTATAGTQQVGLSWTNPSDADFTGTMIRFKTTGYPTSTTDGTLVVDDPGTPSAADGVTHSGLTAGVTYYYSAWSHDGVPNYTTTKRDANATPTAPSLSTISTKSAANMNLVIDGSSADWTLGDFTTKSLGGQNSVGDYAIVGYDGGVYYRADYEFAVPTNAADHTCKVYSRHDQQFMYLLIRCDDDQMNYAQAADTNWANDCVELYIDPGNNGGATALTHPGSSASDMQLVLDANNQKNVYCCTDAYKSQVLAGITSAVVRDGTGWTLEVKIAKSAVDPDFPASGAIGVDFAFRDNDNPDANNIAGNPASSTMDSWRDATAGSFPSKIPDNWGDASLVALSADTTPPAAVTGLGATPGSLQVTLNWTNPATADWAGTQVRFKTGGYPTGPADGAQIYNGTGTTVNHTGLTAGVTYYYCAYAYDEVPNHASAAQVSATAQAGATVETINTKSAANLNLVIDGSSSDWTLGDFTTNSLGGQNGAGDIAVAGYSGGSLYYGGRCTDFALPASAADHTGKVYSRHDQQYVYFLVRCDDDQMNYAQAQGTNWANDCVEFYIDPGHDHGATSINNSTSDIQLVIDANNQKNVYMCTAGYASQVLAGVTSAVVRDGTGWTMEVKIAKSAVDPDLPASGDFGVDFAFRDNDNPDGVNYGGNPASSTMYSWADGSSQAAFPTKIPDHWGDSSLANLAADTTAPAAVTSLAASAGSGQVSLSWTNPATADWAGTMIRFKTGSYPTGPTDGTQIYSGTGASYAHTNLTAGVTYYYCAYAYDEVPNYATAAQANGTPSAGAPQLISNSAFASNADGWTTATWRAGDTYGYGTMDWASSGGNPSGCMASTGNGSSDNTDRCLREGGEITKTISTSGHSGVKVYYDLKVNGLGGNNTGSGTGACTVDHSLVDEQLTVFYSTNGGTNWTEAEYLTRSSLLGSYQSFGTRTIDLTGVSACNDNANFALRFRWQFNQGSDSGWLDNIKVEVQN